MAESMPKLIGVIGGGRMGAGIAQVFAAAGTEVVVAEGDAAAATAAGERILAGLRKAVELGKLADADAAYARVALVTSPTLLPAEVELVVEAVPEIPEVKTEVLAAVEQAIGPDAVLASNTSSLSITELSAVLSRPERFIGMHFFNPVPASKLVEIVLTERSADGARDQAVGWVRGLGKTEVVVKDSPGFATSRLGVLLGLEAIRMLEEGVADAASIDTAMELGYRHPMGPLRSTDLVGLDVRLAVAEYLTSTLGERFAPPRLLREKVARGELGRKAGRGFYDWD
ncbi:MAG TPA: 3-hydroxyacyl-CoA dehydrogenase family protein [Pseudonocardiaceae bacterium]|jgi:3-hydroxybutyryl-CoA dehydrogenase|nr:3-hydroxyacyl-CoA dehydrogenase family protein [Pseudonocardiaceae bacterium]